MAAFRRCLIALAGLATFAGLASAQAPTPMTCTVASTGANARAEGKAELTGDIVISCTGGTALVTAGGSASATGVAVPTMDLTVTLPVNITSRQSAIASTTPTQYSSDALLLIDEPQSFAGALVPGFGIGAPPNPCGITLTGQVPQGCTVYPNQVSNFEVMSPNPNEAIGSPSTGAKNVYQGVVSGKAVTFYGVPVLPPGSTASRIFRITNVRIDATGAGAGAQVATITSVAHTSGIPTAMPGLSTTPTVATVASGLKISSAPLSLTNCAPNAYTYAGTVSFAENFGNAFKTRIPSASNTLGGSQLATNAVQGTPGQNSNNAESGYILPSLTIGTSTLTAGLADFGTRLKAVFNNIPAGVHVFVSFNNVYNSSSTNYGTVTSLTAGGTATNSIATFVGSNEVAAYSTSTTGSNPTGGPTIGINEITPSTTGAVAGTSYTAVWEVTNSNANSSETFAFAVFATAPGQLAPAQVTVNLSFAPLETTTPTSTTPSNIPNFVDANAGTAQNAFSVIQCKTTLLFPFVTSANGFDTGLTVANTTSDTFGTTPQAGSCQFTLYGTPTPVPTIPATASVAAGTVTVLDLGSVAPGFTGYAIAVCNFQFGHGFAFIANYSSPSVSSSMGYLSLVLPYSTTRVSSFEGLSQ